MIIRRLVIAATLIILAGPAFAGPTCTSEPKAKWMGENDMKAKLTAQGYKFKVFKVTSGNCYEIYGRDQKGKRVEIYFHPVTGAVVEEHKS